MSQSSSMLVPVCHALTGELLRIELGEGVLVEELRNTLKRQTSVDIDSQVLICEWDPTSNLDKSKPLKHYGLPKEGHTIFFYDTSWFSSAEPPTLPSAGIPKIDVQLPTQEESIAGSSFLATPSADVEPMQTALYNYAASFTHWKKTAEAYEKAAIQRLQACERVVAQLGLQRRAGRLALLSLRNYRVVVESSLRDLEEGLAAAAAQREEMLDGMESSLRGLVETPLDPAHVAAYPQLAGTGSVGSDGCGAGRLISLLGRTAAAAHGSGGGVGSDAAQLEAMLRERAAVCRAAGAQAAERVAEEARQLREVAAKVDEELARGGGGEALDGGAVAAAGFGGAASGRGGGGGEDDRSAREAEQALEAMHPMARKAEALREAMAADLVELERHLAQEARTGYDWEYINGLQKKYLKGKDRLAELDDADRFLQERCGVAGRAKEAMTRQLVRRLQRVADLQRCLVRRHKALGDLRAVSFQETRRRFADVERALRLPETYPAWRREVALQRRYWRDAVAAAGSFSAAAERRHASETARRRVFLSRFESLLPEALLHPLLESGGGAAAALAAPPCVEVSVTGRPTRLPAIDLTLEEEEEVQTPNRASPASPSAATDHESWREAAAAAAAVLERPTHTPSSGAAVAASEMPPPILPDVCNASSAPTPAATAITEASSLRNPPATAAAASAGEATRRAAQDIQEDFPAKEAAVAAAAAAAAAVALAASEEEKAVLKGRAEAAEGEAERARRAGRETEEQLLALRGELERKTKCFREATDNAARLELDLNYAKEKLVQEQAQADRMYRGLLRLGETLKVEVRGLAPGPVLVSGRGRKVSEGREVSDEGMEGLLSRARTLADLERASASSPALATPALPASSSAATAAGLGGLAGRLAADSRCKLAINGFVVGDVVLFMPLSEERTDSRGHRVFTAFNSGSPWHFMHPQSVALFHGAADQPLGFCLGRITAITEHVSTGSRPDQLFGRAAGERYWVCVVAALDRTPH